MILILYWISFKTPFEKMKQKIFLRKLTSKDVTKNYVRWMNDHKIVKYTEQRYKKHTIKNVTKFVIEKQKSKNEFLYGIFLKNKKKEHIGNIKLGPINFTHRYGEISYFIGNKNYWGKNYATKAISEIIKIAKNVFKLKKLQAGFYEMNHRSKAVLQNNKFKLEGIFKSQIIFRGKRYKHFWYGLIL